MRPQESELTCMAPRASTIQEQGFSDKVATRIEAPQTLSTRAVCKSKWVDFVKWCKSNKVDFWSPSVTPIVDFLLHLFFSRRENCSPVPLRVIGWPLLIWFNDKLNIGKDENSTHLLNSFNRDTTPKGSWGVPTWNLSLALH